MVSCKRTALIFFTVFWGFVAVLQVSVVNQLDMQVVVSNVPPTYVEKNKDKLLRWGSFPSIILASVSSWRWKLRLLCCREKSRIVKNWKFYIIVCVLSVWILSPLLSVCAFTESTEAVIATVGKSAALKRRTKTLVFKHWWFLISMKCPCKAGALCWHETEHQSATAQPNRAKHIPVS